MIKSLAVARVQQLLGFRSDLLEEAGQALIESQEDAESGELGFLPWFLRSTLRILLPANSREIPLPNDYLREYDHERYALWFTRAGPAVRVEYFSPSGDGTLKSGRPCYWVDSAALILDRSFNEAVDVEYLYYRRDNTLEEDIENSWLRYGSRYMIGSAGVKMLGLENTNAARLFASMQLEGKAQLLRNDAAFRSGSKKPQFGGGTDREYGDTYGYSIRYNDLDLGD